MHKTAKIRLNTVLNPPIHKNVGILHQLPYAILHTNLHLFITLLSLLVNMQPALPTFST